MLFDSHRDGIAAFPGSSVSDCTVVLNIWNTIRDSEDAGRREDTTEKASMAQTLHHPVKVEHIDLDMMGLNTINLEEMGMDEGLVIYEKVWEASASAHSIGMPQYFRVGLFLDTTIRKQEKAVELLGMLCGDLWRIGRGWMRVYNLQTCGLYTLRRRVCITFQNRRKMPEYMWGR